ncbi:glycosyltransferase family 2 protein [Xylophilus sp. GOD-11R]|uniref:glycosyltransferase family 2 protein n=1 Tax=Xylophilus sp. GOD-11R TaxID=3089814 RepID=UPI00298C712E|nr:glycosyltransferase family 2 protein [Xylophilus sp. GOD-11R]WPB57806.1 glycosyltransferase family 2 protein [Xylophilus sp. GOD-11R]
MTVSIVSHGQIELIKPLLEQLARLCSAEVERVVLTINRTEIIGELPAASYALHLIHNNHPKGFGANHNAAFAAHGGSPWFLVLNPDIRLSSNVLAPLLAHARPDAGLLAPRVFEPGKTTPEAHRGLLTPLEILNRRKPGYPTPTNPAWLPGLFMLFRSTAYREVGGFDDRYFMYGEDFDISARLRLAGKRIQICEQLQVEHDARRASHADHSHLRWHMTSLVRLWTSSAFWRYRALLRAGG